MNNPLNQTNSNQASSWMAVATSKALRKKPLGVYYREQAVVLFRDGSQRVNALPDRCPHRGAPLSSGRVTGDAIECPYHGWQFNGRGDHLELPGASAGFTLGAAVIQPFDVIEDSGLIWLRHHHDEPGPRYVPVFHETHRCHTLTASVSADIVDVAENFLDALHTHFVHAGGIRSRRAPRHPCQVSVADTDDGYEVIYVEEKSQSGLFSKLFGRNITHNIGRVRYPGIVEIEYHSGSGIELAVVAYLNRLPDGKCALIIRNYFSQGKIPFPIAVAVLIPFQWLALMQDKRILEATARQRAANPGFSLVITRYDVMRPYIEKALNNDIGPAQKKLRLWL